jgi:hypothetical protein
MKAFWIAVVLIAAASMTAALIWRTRSKRTTHGGEVSAQLRESVFMLDAAKIGIEQAIGQFTIYYEVLSRVEPDRRLFLAVSEEGYVNLLKSQLVRY